MAKRSLLSRCPSYTPMLHAGSRVLQLLLPTSYAMKKYMTNAGLEGTTATRWLILQRKYSRSVGSVDCHCGPVAVHPYEIR